MQRKLPDLSTTQLIASGLATAAAAVGASYLGVYGTILGAAFMSVVSTAGSAVCKHYLDQGREQIKDLGHLQAAAQQRDAARGAAAEAVSADPTRTVVWSDPNVTRMDLDPGVTRVDPSMDPSMTVADALAGMAGEEAVREVVRRSALRSTADWARHHWVKLVVTSAVVFAVVLGGITVYEAAAGGPIGDKGNGLTVTKVLGGGGTTKQSPRDTPSTERSPEEETPSGEPSGETPTERPTGGLTDGTTAPPTERPTDGPTTTRPSTPTAPSTPTPTPGTGGEEQGGAEPQRSAPAG
ncbi:hypothetical protein AGRA3207_001456 [Actinomadura graeca]|uniref:Uncharacterized protein n=1 Tax=Actinomadura graeca TaxID=2750812 RepID=A0ABX8QTE1_9ACTN|nr:PT domain-containing protein [Actinomadura graeca]QXJ20697.1 hypothetical protein AGRA3207_001456 [Actinomadura graeca]